jgi:hypothetical protein
MKDEVCFARRNQPTHRSSLDWNARQSGYADGGREAKLMLLAIGKGFERSQAIGWLDTVIEEGRADLLAQRAINREIDAWEMSCRIMFMVAISASKSSRR